MNKIMMIHSDEYYPFYMMSENDEHTWYDGEAIEVSKEFIARYTRIMKEFDELQEHLQNLVEYKKERAKKAKECKIVLNRYQDAVDLLSGKSLNDALDKIVELRDIIKELESNAETRNQIPQEHTEIPNRS